MGSAVSRLVAAPALDAEPARVAAPAWLESGAVPALDGLRALAVGVVMAAHSGLERIVPGGFGVTLFFFISGFLITTLMLREWREAGRVRIAAFYARRALRLYPPLLVYLLAVVAAQVALARPVDLLGLFGALFYGGNYLAALAPERIHAFGTHLWSLAVEEHFYLLYPLVFAALARARAPMAILAACCALALGLRCVEALAGARDDYLFFATEARFDSILYGALLAFAAASPAMRPRLAALAHPAAIATALALILASLLIRDPFFRVTLRYSLQGVALATLFAGLLFAAPTAWPRRLLDARPARWIGALSYTLYLWHAAIFALAAALLPQAPRVVVVGAGWLGALAVAASLYRTVETPLFAWRRRLGSGVRALA